MTSLQVTLQVERRRVEHDGAVFAVAVLQIALALLLVEQLKQR